MTSYHGGKQRIGKHIASYINEKYGGRGYSYIEPFCGMLGVYRYVDKFDDYILGDVNKSLIKMWKKWKKKTTREKKKEKILNKLRTNKDTFMNYKEDTSSSWKKGFIGHFYDFRGIYFSSYKIRPESALLKSINNCIDIGEKLDSDDASLVSSSYRSINACRCVIYCDPPYLKQSKYYDDERVVNNDFKYEEFIEWCKKMKQQDNVILMSEYDADKSIFTEVLNFGKEKLYIFN
jgi:site-specific DNA-adenine methylase